ncbi:hypothetical protein D083_3643 [Dickeya solani RNS 08.23.3.1.A]|nr:hypothetical protein D083_3643 [Dickeya solani RNS 08.23.3.1.A]
MNNSNLFFGDYLHAKLIIKKSIKIKYTFATLQKPPSINRKVTL